MSAKLGRRSRAAACWMASVLGALGCTGRIEAVVDDDTKVTPARVTARPDAGERVEPRTPRVDAGSSGRGTDDPDPITGSEREDAGSSGRAEPDPSERVCDAVTEVLLPSCGGGSCHSNADARIGDWGAGREQAESFVDVPSVRNAACGVIIDSHDPAQSLLLRKLIGDFPSPMCGGPMPVSGPDLTDAQIACMASWLTQFQR